MSRIALTFAFLFLLWRLCAPAAPALPLEHRASLVPAMAHGEAR